MCQIFTSLKRAVFGQLQFQFPSTVMTAFAKNNSVDLSGRGHVLYMGNAATLVYVPSSRAGQEVDCSCSCKATHGGNEQ